MPGSAADRRLTPFLAILAAKIVLAGGVRVMNHGIADHQPHLRVDRHQPSGRGCGNR